GVTHECDYPPEAREKNHVILSIIDPGKLSSREIDEIISRNVAEGKSTYLIDRDALREADPDLILTQELCQVCAVSGNEVTDALEALGKEPEIISLEPRTLGEILETIIVVGEATGTAERAREVTERLARRIEKVRSNVGDVMDRPRVFCLEWLDPPYAAGHWVPEMVEIAGGRMGLGKAGEPSFKVSWKEIAEFAPQMLFIMPCGYDIEKTMDEIDIVMKNDEWFSLPSTSKGHIYVFDANSYFSRPGPRVVDGLEILAKTIHPEAMRSYDPPPDSVVNLRNYMQFELFLG
ncbi:MAG TPA: cobalamin-binding protein, partial [Thermodesulfobacteriota bacterium]|nr:cobalamin-binding protein [Thermodesulfobacteriota bacterium]